MTMRRRILRGPTFRLGSSMGSQLLELSFQLNLLLLKLDTKADIANITRLVRVLRRRCRRRMRNIHRGRAPIISSSLARAPVIYTIRIRNGMTMMIPKRGWMTRR